MAVDVARVQVHPRPALPGPGEAVSIGGRFYPWRIEALPAPHAVRYDVAADVPASDPLTASDRLDSACLRCDSAGQAAAFDPLYATLRNERNAQGAPAPAAPPITVADLPPRSWNTVVRLRLHGEDYAILAGVCGSTTNAVAVLRRVDSEWMPTFDLDRCPLMALASELHDGPTAANHAIQISSESFAALGTVTPTPADSETPWPSEPLPLQEVAERLVASGDVLAAGIAINRLAAVADPELLAAAMVDPKRSQAGRAVAFQAILASGLQLPLELALTAARNAPEAIRHELSDGFDAAPGYVRAQVEVFVDRLDDGTDAALFGSCSTVVCRTLDPKLVAIALARLSRTDLSATQRSVLTRFIPNLEGPQLRPVLIHLIATWPDDQAAWAAADIVAAVDGPLAASDLFAALEQGGISKRDSLARLVRLFDQVAPAWGARPELVERLVADLRLGAPVRAWLAAEALARIAAAHPNQRGMIRDVLAEAGSRGVAPVVAKRMQTLVAGIR